MENYRKQSRDELLQELTEKRRELREFRFAVAGSQTRDVREARQLRVDIARILTVLREQSTVA